MDWKQELGKKLAIHRFKSQTDTVEGIKSYLIKELDDLELTLNHYSNLNRTLIRKRMSECSEQHVLYNANGVKKGLYFEYGDDFVKINKISNKDFPGVKEIALILTKDKGPQSIGEVGSEIRWYDSKTSSFTEKIALKEEMIDEIFEYAFNK